MEKKRWGFDWVEFLVGVIFLIAAYCALSVPLASVIGIVIIFAVAAIIKGIGRIATYSKLKEYTGSFAMVSLVVAIFDLIIGVWLIYDVQVGIISVGFIFAIWFIIDAIAGLTNSQYLKSFHTGYYVLSMIINILGIILGIWLLFNPALSVATLALLIGFYFIFFGLSHIIFAFAKR